MFAFLLNPGGRKHPKRSKRSKSSHAKRSRAARRAYRRRLYGRIGATKTRYKTLARRLVHRLTCAPGAARRWHAARRRCPVSSTSSSAADDASFSAGWYGAGENPRRRRRNGRRAKFHYCRGRNTSWLPAFAMNGINMKQIASGYQPDMLMKGAVTLVGFIGNALVSKQVAGLGFVPSFLKAGPGSYAVGLGTAGVTGALVSLASPKYAIPVLFGGVLQQIVKAYNEYIAPKASFLPTLGSFDDYATVEQVANARPLGCLFGGCSGGMGSWAGPQDLFNQDVMPSDGGTGLLGMGCMNGNCMGDYLTPQAAAAARPLGALGYTLNDAAIDGTATTELGSVD